MSWGMIGGTAVSMIGSAVMSNNADDPEGSGLSYQANPRVERTEDYLEKYGTDMLEGDMNDYYSLIGDIGGPESTAKRNQIMGDIGRSVNESYARTGRSGGPAMASVKARETARAGIDYDMAELLQAKQGRQQLLGYGLGTMGDVASRGINVQNAENQYNLSVAEMEAQNESSGIGDMMGDVGSIAGMIYGANKGGGTSEKVYYPDNRGSATVNNASTVGGMAGYTDNNYVS